MVVIPISLLNEMVSLESSQAVVKIIFSVWLNKGYEMVHGKLSELTHLCRIGFGAEQNHGGYPVRQTLGEQIWVDFLGYRQTGGIHHSVKVFGFEVPRLVHYLH